MATKEERLKALEIKQAQIKAQIQQLKARDNEKDRKSETRRKILIGGFVLSNARESIASFSIDSKKFTDSLKSDRDRALFGLPPLAENSALSPASEAGGV